MPPDDDPRLRTRTTKAVHGSREIAPDAKSECGFSEFLRAHHDHAQLIDLYSRYALGLSEHDALMRRVLWRAMAAGFGNGVCIEPGATFKHPETFEIGSGVFIGSYAFIQGRHDGRCVIGDRTWIGPQAYLDARALVIEDDVGWGPGAKVLGSAHTGLPVDVPIIRTDLQVKPVRIGAEADIGVNAVILPGVTVGHSSIVGAGAVVTEDVAPFSIVAGVPAKFLRWRDGYKPQSAR